MKKNHLLFLLAILLGTAVSSSAFANFVGHYQLTGGIWTPPGGQPVCPFNTHITSHGCVKN